MIRIILTSLLRIFFLNFMLLSACSSPSANTGESVAVWQTSEQSPSQQVDEVPLVEPARLKDLLQDNNIILLDTRSSQEYQSSHLEGSRFVNFQTFQMSDVQDIPKDAEIIVYCAVGGRSNWVAVQLLSAGYHNVRNLKGGIANWKNQGYEVVND
jgi:rhodanese-related sulfurtransferase